MPPPRRPHIIELEVAMAEPERSLGNEIEVDRTKEDDLCGLSIIPVEGRPASRDECPVRATADHPRHARRAPRQRKLAVWPELIDEDVLARFWDQPQPLQCLAALLHDADASRRYPVHHVHETEGLDRGGFLGHGARSGVRDLEVLAHDLVGDGTSGRHKEVGTCQPCVPRSLRHTGRAGLGVPAEVRCCYSD